MKHLILSIALILTVSSNLLVAAPQKIINRTKTNCVPGCNTVTRTETLVTWERADGKLVDALQIDITCSGSAFSSCPNQMAAPPASYPDGFTETCGNTQFDYAINQISLGTNSGSHNQNHLNTSTGETWKFSVVWSIVSGVETIEVFMEFLY